MHPMRPFITAVTEAPRTAKPSMSHEQRVAQELARRAQVLGAAKKAAEALKARAMKLATDAQQYDFAFRQKWDQSWAEAAKAAVREKVKAAEAAAQADLDYRREDNPDAQPEPIDKLDCVNEGFSAWWDAQHDRLDWGDANYRWERYCDAHNQTESSDDMTRLDYEKELLTQFRHMGAGFGSLAEMDKAVSALDGYIHYTNTISDGGWSHMGEVTVALIQAGLPAILLFCRLLGAAPAAAAPAAPATPAA